MLCIANLTNPVKLYELAGMGYQPNRVYSHGPYAYIDNTFELIVLQTFGHDYLVITTIPYPSLLGGQSVGIGVTDHGIYMAFTTTDLSLNTICFIPKN